MSEKEKQEMSRLAQIAQGYQQQGQFLQQQAGAIQANMAEINNTLEALKNLRESDKTEILLPIGAGVYFMANIKDKDKVLTDIGANVISEKTLEQAVELLKKRLVNSENLLNKTQKGLEEVGQELQKIDNEAKKLINKMKDSDVRPAEK